MDRQFDFSGAVVIGELLEFQFIPDELHLAEHEFGLVITVPGTPVPFGSGRKFTMGRTQPDGPLIIWAITREQHDTVAHNFAIRLSSFASSPPGMHQLGEYRYSGKHWYVHISEDASPRTG